MTQNINFEATEQEINFIKKLAAKHMPGMPDNHCTADPIHVVEKKRYDYIPWFEGSQDYYGDYPLVMTIDDEYKMWFEDEQEMVADYMANNHMDDDIKFPIMSFEQLDGQTVFLSDGEEIDVYSLEDYFRVYGIELKAMSWKKEYWEPVAYFFIREEAERYREYQKHNLGVSRVYTHNMGYSNHGDLPVFRDMLLRIGEQLNKEE